MILNIQWKTAKKLLTNNERFVYFKRDKKNYTILVDNQNVLLKTKVPFFAIKKKYNPKNELSQEETLKRFEKDNLTNRKNSIRFFDKDYKWIKAIAKRQIDNEFKEELIIKNNKIKGKNSGKTYFIIEKETF